jgi:hypothetical protein
LPNTDFQDQQQEHEQHVSNNNMVATKTTTRKSRKTGARHLTKKMKPAAMKTVKTVNKRTQKPRKPRAPLVPLVTVMDYILRIAFERPLDKWLKLNGGFRGHSNPRHPRLEPSYLRTLKKIKAHGGRERWIDSQEVYFSTAMDVLYKKHHKECLQLLAKHMAAKRVSYDQMIKMGGSDSTFDHYKWPAFTESDKATIEKLVAEQPKQQYKHPQTLPQIFSCQQEQKIHAGHLGEVFNFSHFW